MGLGGSILHLQWRQGDVLWANVGTCFWAGRIFTVWLTAMMVSFRTRPTESRHRIPASIIQSASNPMRAYRGECLQSMLNPRHTWFRLMSKTDVPRRRSNRSEWKGLAWEFPGIALGNSGYWPQEIKDQHYAKERGCCTGSRTIPVSLTGSRDHIPRVLRVSRYIFPSGSVAATQLQLPYEVSHWAFLIRIVTQRPAAKAHA